MTSAMTSCADWLNSTPAETKVEPFGLSPWSQQKTGPNSEMTQCAALQVCSRLHQLCGCAVYLKRHFAAQSNIVAWLYRKTRIRQNVQRGVGVTYLGFTWIDTFFAKICAENNDSHIFYSSELDLLWSSKLLCQLLLTWASLNVVWLSVFELMVAMDRQTDGQTDWV